MAKNDFESFNKMAMRLKKFRESFDDDTFDKSDTDNNYILTDIIQSKKY